MAYLNYSQASAIESCLSAVQRIMEDVYERSPDELKNKADDSIDALYSALNVARDSVENLAND